MESLNEETKNKIQELQILEQNLQNSLLQKQAFQLEFDETMNALEEVKKTNGDVYKIMSNVMIKVEKEGAEKELSQKKELLNLRINNIEKQEKLLKDKADKLREEIIKKIK